MSLLVLFWPSSVTNFYSKKYSGRNINGICVRFVALNLRCDKVVEEYRVSYAKVDKENGGVRFDIDITMF